MSSSEMAVYAVLLGQALTALAAIFAAVISFVNSRNIKEVHLMVNSRLTQLLESSSRAAHSEGVEAGRQQEEMRQETAGTLEQ